MGGIVIPMLAFVAMMVSTCVLIAVSAIIRIRIQNTLRDRWDYRDEFRVVYWIADEILMTALTVVILEVHLMILLKMYRPIIPDEIGWTILHYVGVFPVVLFGFRPSLMKISSHAIQCRNDNSEAQTPLTISCIIGIATLLLYAALWGDTVLRF